MGLVEMTAKDTATVLAEERTNFALERTRIASERTLMAWIRTSISMIGFGFTIVKFFQYMPVYLFHFHLLKYLLNRYSL